jgi:hypothetical protein
MSACVEVALESVRPEVAAHVLHHFSPSEGHAEGAFITKLLEAFDLADPFNRSRLRISFPAYGLAFHIAKDHHLGTDALRSIVAQSSGV